MHSKKMPMVGMIMGAAHLVDCCGTLQIAVDCAAGSEVKRQEGFIINKAEKQPGKLIKG